MTLNDSKVAVRARKGKAVAYYKYLGYSSSILPLCADSVEYGLF